MKIGILGANLQGLEAAYLAKAAGYEVVVADKRPSRPARFLADRFIEKNIRSPLDLSSVFEGVDLALPALENDPALEALCRWGEERGIPVAFGLPAYRITASKITSDALFQELGIPCPLPWPECGFPVIAKPSHGSGSNDVLKIMDLAHARTLFQKGFPPKDWVVQKYVHGPSYSIEIIGKNERYNPLVVTELFMDSSYDCKRVTAPVDLTPKLKKAFKEIALTLAKAVSLNGIMDVEVILHEGELKVLEIDARLPSQTPIAVYRSTGVNMVRLLADLFLYDQWPGPIPVSQARGCILEHIAVSPRRIEVIGEHALSGREGLTRMEDFFGADEAVTDYAPGRDTWAATLIITGSTLSAASEKRDQIIARIRRDLGLARVVDENPFNGFTKS
jgi:3-methylornithine--L-lysine ligase